MMPSLAKPQQSAGVDHWHDQYINLVYNFCSIITMPVELALRPFHGSRCFPPIIMLFSAGLMIVLPLFVSFAGAVEHFIPFVSFRASTGLLGMWGLSKLFFLGCVIHNVRKWKLMTHPERERYSYYEGPPLFFFNWLPNPSYVRVRIVYEPLFLVTLSIILPSFLLIEPSVANYLVFASMFLAMKGYAEWYISWAYLRDVMDGQAIGPVIAAIIQNRATDEQRAEVHLAAFPKDTSPDICQRALSSLARLYPVDNEFSQGAEDGKNN